MKSLHHTVKDYLRVRRALGYKLQRHERLLLSFVSFLTQAKSSFITQQLALAWATGIAGNSAKTAAQRLGVVRGFAKFVRTLDPRTEIPPPECLPYRKTRPLPYISQRRTCERSWKESGRFP